MTMKFCKECQAYKTIDSFYKHPNMHDGHLSFCKECVCERIGNHRAKHIEEARRKDKERYEKKKSKPGYQEKENVRHRKWRTPEKMKAHNTVERKLKASKPMNCESCRTEGKLSAHHPNYAAPENVLWVCQACHSAIHQQ